MIGNPKYKYCDNVVFTIGNVKRDGVVWIVDKYGTFDDDSNVCYDIFVENENTLYKHINEDVCEKKVR